MIRFNESEPIELMSRLGRVGTARSFDLWQFRESVEQAVEGVAQIASLSYGNEEAKNPQKLFDRIVSLGHLSCLEFIPFKRYFPTALPEASAQNFLDVATAEDGINEFLHHFSEIQAQLGREQAPATGFLIEAPVLVARQWMRHRAFSYLEMSRRYVKDSKVPFDFYGWLPFGEDPVSVFYDQAVALYDALIAAGEPAELARRVIPVGMMTKFFVAGYNYHWKGFTRLRSDLHAQPEIRVFSDFIKEVVK